MGTKKTPQLANSFSINEVSALLTLHRILLRGGDAKAWLQSESLTSVMRKFQAMHAKHDAAMRVLDQGALARVGRSS